MKIGIDFENAMINFDEFIYEMALEAGHIDEGANKTKDAIESYLSNSGREIEWLNLKKAALGPRIVDAPAYIGLIRFLALCKEHGVECVVLSQHPINADRIDSEYRQLASHWLMKHGVTKFLCGESIEDKVHFLTRKNPKQSYAKEIGCTHFVNDRLQLLTLTMSTHSDRGLLVTTTVENLPIAALKQYHPTQSATDRHVPLQVNTAEGDSTWNDIIHQLDGVWHQRWKLDPFKTYY